MREPDSLFIVLVLVFCVEEKWFGTSAVGEAGNDWC